MVTQLIAGNGIGETLDSKDFKYQPLLDMCGAKVYKGKYDNNKTLSGYGFDQNGLLMNSMNNYACILKEINLSAEESLVAKIDPTLLGWIGTEKNPLHWDIHRRGYSLINRFLPIKNFEKFISEVENGERPMPADTSISSMKEKLRLLKHIYPDSVDYYWLSPGSELKIMTPDGKITGINNSEFKWEIPEISYYDEKTLDDLAKPFKLVLIPSSVGDYKAIISSKDQHVSEIDFQRMDFLNQSSEIMQGKVQLKANEYIYIDSANPNILHRAKNWNDIINNKEYANMSFDNLPPISSDSNPLKNSDWWKFGVGAGLGGLAAVGAGAAAFYFVKRKKNSSLEEITQKEISEVEEFHTKVMNNVQKTQNEYEKLYGKEEEKPVASMPETQNKSKMINANQVVWDEEEEIVDWDEGSIINLLE